MENNNNLWNIKNLLAPPVSSYVSKSQIDTTKITRVFKEAINFFANQKYLEAEAAVLSRCIYRMKMKYRSDKGFKALLKLNRCLLQYLRMNFGNVITIFYELLPTNKAMNAYLPTRNMIDYILVRLQGLAMLLNRIIEMCQVTALFTQQKIFRGDFWKLALIILSVASRIWIVVKKLLKFSCQFYSDILPFRDVIQIGGYRWLPNGYKLPSNLETWLTEQQALESNEYKINDFNKQCTMRFNESSEKLMESIDQIIPEMKSSSKKDCNNFYLMAQSNDIGEVVDADEINFLNNDTKILQNKNSFKLLNEKHKEETSIVSNYFDLKQNELSSLSGEDKSSLTKSRNNSKKAKTKILCLNNGQNVKKKSLVENNKQLKSKVTKKKDNEISEVLENINSASQLKQFLKIQETCRNNKQECISSKLDKLQWHILEKRVKQYIKKANILKSNNYLLKAKDMLKISLS